MFTEKNIEIEDYEIDDLDFTWVNLEFSCNYDILGIKVTEGEWANMYVIINPFTNELHAEYELSEEDYAKIYDIKLSNKDKEVLRNCAEKFIKNGTGMTMTEYCEFLMKQELSMRAVLKIERGLYYDAKNF